MGASSDLGKGIGLDAAEVAVFHLLSQKLATGGVDALADHHERAIKTDHDILGGRANNGFSHGFLAVVFAIMASLRSGHSADGWSFAVMASLRSGHFADGWFEGVVAPLGLSLRVG